MTELLLLVGVAVLVAANGFFVASEFALVRARQTRVEVMRMRVAAARRWRWRRSTASTSTCRPASLDHHGLARHRVPGRAGHRESDREADRRLHFARHLAGDLAAIAYLITTALHHAGRAGAEDLCDRARGGHRPARGASASVLPHRFQPADPAAELGIERRAAAAGGRLAGGVRGDQLLRGSQAADRPERAWGKIDAGEAGCSRVSSISTSSRRVR